MPTIGKWYTFQLPSGTLLDYHIHFRVLAEIKNKLYFIEADKKLTYDAFTKELKKLKVKNAIYLDTGYGWETYFYKNSKNKKVYKHATLHSFPFRSNFLLIE